MPKNANYINIMLHQLMIYQVFLHLVHSVWYRLKMHEESSSRRKVDEDVHDGAVPAYLLDRENTTRAKVICV